MTRRSIVASFVVASFLGCATSRIPSALRGYDIVVEGKDEQSVELARAMRDYGFRVRDRVRGGSRPTAALIHFTFSEPGRGQPIWLHLRLADTRSGAIVGTSMVEIDSLLPTARARAQAAVTALTP